MSAFEKLFVNFYELFSLQPKNKVLVDTQTLRQGL